MRSSFLTEIITINTVNVWSRMNKVKLKTWKSVRKEVKTSISNEVIFFKDKRSLFSCLLIVVKSRLEINLKDAIGKYEITTLPQSIVQSRWIIGNV